MQYADEEKKKIKKLRKSTRDVRMHVKLLVISLHMDGYSNKQIAKIVALDEHTVGTYIKKYRMDGIDGLGSKPITGRPTLLSKLQEDELYITIKEKTPDEVGFGPFKNWTAKLACSWVEAEFNVKFSIGGMTDLFHRIGLSNTRPTYVLAKADAKEQGQFAVEFSDVKKKLLNNEINHILFEDESTIRNYQAIMRTWFPTGEQRIIKTYGKHEGVKLTGVIDYESGTVYVEENEEFNAQIFIDFLENVLKRYPKGKIVMVLDNSKVHHAKLIDQFLEGNKRLRLMFLPPYSPDLNIIEGLWGWLKDSCINNIFFSKIQEIKRAVRKFIVWVNDNPQTVIDRLCVQM